MDIQPTSLFHAVARLSTSPSRAARVVERSPEGAFFEGELGTHYLALKNERVFVANLVIRPMR